MKIVRNEIHQFIIDPEDFKEQFLYDLTGNLETKSYNYAWQRWVTDYEEVPAYLNNEDGTYGLGKGYTDYLITHIDQFDEESQKILLEENTSRFKSENLEIEGLRDYQQLWVTELLSHPRCVCQTPTGKGKTEVISRLVLWLLDRNETVLILASGSKVIDEIKNRLWSLREDLYIPDYWDSDSKINIIFPVGFAKSYSYDPKEEFFDRVSVVLTDEVDRATSETTLDLIYEIRNPKCCYYGFSATAEKVKAEKIDIRENVHNLKAYSTFELVSLFGMSWVFEKPKDFDITISEVVSHRMREISDAISENIDSESAIYRSIVDTIFSHREYLFAVKELLGKVKHLFIPINDLTYIDRMIDFLSEDYHIATITLAGYWSSKEGFIDLARLKYLCEENQINLLLTSSSGFAGVDFRGINNILMTLGVYANIVIQCIGRVSRSKKFNIYYITPGGEWKLPIYTKNCINQLSLINDYYSECRITYKEDILN